MAFVRLCDSCVSARATQQITLPRLPGSPIFDSCGSVYCQNALVSQLRDLAVQQFGEMQIGPLSTVTT